MAIIEKPSTAGEIFATPREALEQASPVIEIQIADFVESFDQPEVQAVVRDATSRGRVRRFDAARRPNRLVGI